MMTNAEAYQRELQKYNAWWSYMKASEEAMTELTNARERFGPMVSAHEGFAILLEEVDELWEEVRGNKRDKAAYLAACRKEAVQVAAMALAFIVEVCDAAS